MSIVSILGSAVMFNDDCVSDHQFLYCEGLNVVNVKHWTRWILNSLLHLLYTCVKTIKIGQLVQLAQFGYRPWVACNKLYFGRTYALSNVLSYFKNITPNV